MRAQVGQLVLQVRHLVPPRPELGGLMEPKKVPEPRKEQPEPRKAQPEPRKEQPEPRKEQPEPRKEPEPLTQSWMPSQVAWCQGLCWRRAWWPSREWLWRC